MLIDTASRPLPVMRSVRSGAPRVTVPRSDTRRVVPFFTFTGACAMSSRLVHRPEASARCCSPDSWNRPTGSTVFCALQRVGHVHHRQLRGGQPGWVQDDLDLAGVAGLYLDGPAPGTRASSGFITKLA